MSWMPEPEPTPLRLRLGPRSEVPLPPAFEDADSFDVAEDLDARIESASAQTLEPTAERVDKWMADQRRRLGLGIDAMVASLKEQRDTELSRIEEWKQGERER